MNKRIKDLFIPHEGNGYKPDFLQRLSVGVMLLLILSSFALANLQAILWMTSDWMVSTVLPAVLVELTNEERADQSLGFLSMNADLAEAARLKAEHMAANEYFAHYAPDGTTPWHWFDEVSYDFVHAGENLAVHFTESDEVVRAWMESPAHRANILNGNYTEIGIGTAKGEYKGFPTVFVVQFFGTPAAASAPEPAPETATPEVLAEANSEEEEEPDRDVTVETVTTNEGAEDNGSSVAPATFETATSEERATSSDTPDATSTELTTESTTTRDADPEDERQVTEDTVIVYSDLATTTRGGIPAYTVPTEVGGINGSTPYAQLFAKNASIPSLWLQAVYSVLTVFVIFALIASIFIEWRRQHPVQIAYGTGLLAVMTLLYYAHATLSSGATII